MFIEHVNLTVSDLGRSVDFYRGLFDDFKVRWRGETQNGMPAAHVGNDRQYLALFETRQDRRAEPAYGEVGLNHFGLVVEDLEAKKRRLTELGVEPHSEAHYEPGHRLYFLDPDGIEVELVEYDDGAR